MRNGGRIGRVRMKNGGPELRIFRSKDELKREEMANNIVRHARYIGANEEINGYALIVWCRNGTAFSSWDYIEGGELDYINFPEKLVDVIKRA